MFVVIAVASAVGWGGGGTVLIIIDYNVQQLDKLHASAISLSSGQLK